jgi:hypothetical protein
MNLNLDQVDHVTLDLMVNQPQYERYLRAHEADLNGKYEKAKRFYKKRILEMTRDLLKGDTVNDIFVLQSFEAYAKSDITYFRNKDKNHPECVRSHRQQSGAHSSTEGNQPG